MLKKYAAEPIFKGKEKSFRIRKRFYRIERQRIKKLRSKNYPFILKIFLLY